MRTLERVSSNEMVLAFLQAEIDSPRFRDALSSALSACGASPSIVTNPNLKNADENRLRQWVLCSYRGFKRSQFLFEGFPQDIQWEKVLLDKADLKKLRYANYRTWVELSGGSRLVGDGAQNVDRIQVDENANANIKIVAEKVRQGKKYPPLILVSNRPAGELTLVEGHARATAYLLAQDAINGEIEAIVGYSKAIGRWRFY